MSNSVSVMFRKIIKAILLIYAAAFTVVAIHLPSMTRGFIERGDARRGLLWPAASVAIVRTYGQFALARTWPFGTRPGVVSLEDFVDAHGKVLPELGGVRSVSFNWNPEMRPGQEGRTEYDLNPEYYSRVFYGVYPAISGGGILRIGRYFCLMNSGRSWTAALMGPTNCYELLVQPHNRYYWKPLNQKEAHAVLLEGPPGH